MHVLYFIKIPNPRPYLFSYFLGIPTGVPQPIGGATNLLGIGGSVPPLANPSSSPYGPAGGTAPALSGGLGMITGGHALSAQDKINRELFVGNTPPGTSEALLMQFLNGAMRRVGLCGQNDSPIQNCRTNQKFAFIELASNDAANKALNLNGIPFLGSSLRVSRPSKYAGPHMPSQTWQQLTGQALPPGMMPVPENNGVNPADKVSYKVMCPSGDIGWGYFNIMMNRTLTKLL